ncbi:PqiB family protein [Shewanella holmiensis]|uniref:MlaD family protein n=1 Tax=Shewanella holmiensis TaxID=2952222 RepID=A0A9X3AUC4_9GAMM|nr:MlaD family protein [Shewanella holmiensis]MCT7940218.1 MlaD family protein [Shewanella holmiensis]
MTQIESPKVVKKKLFSPIWLLPIVALMLGAWLGIKSIKESGVEISIHFPSATGIDVGKTLIKYQGLIVGKVTDVSLDKDLNGVNVKVVMDYRADPFLNENTQFWLVQPKASITGVEGLETLFSGNYIAIQPGDGKSRYNFEAQREAPAITPGSEGIVIELHADKLGSIDVGSSIFYRQIPVGSVVGYRLSGSENVIISAFIQEQYAHLVHTDSHFWNVSGLKIDASLAGVKINTESLASILAGGISFNTGTEIEQAENGDVFTLYADEEQANGGLVFNLHLDQAEDISNNASLMYRGVVVGKVEKVSLTESGVSLQASLEQQYHSLLASDSRFWISGADVSLKGMKHLSRLVTGNVINILPGTATDALPPSFLLEQTPPDLLTQQKLSLTLLSDSHTGMSVGAQVRYKQLPIGTVISSRLSDDFSAVQYQVEILPEFKSLVTQGSYFISEQAIKLDASLDSIKFETRDVTTLLEGAVTLVPSKSKSLAKTGSQFKIYDSIETAQKLFTEQQKIKLVLNSQDGAGLSEGAPIYYKKMQIGRIAKIEWQAATDLFSLNLVIDKQFEQLLQPKTVFWRNDAMSVNASLAGVKIDVAPLAGAIKGSISLGFIDDEIFKSVNISSLSSQTGITINDQLYDNQHLALTQAKPITITLPASAKIEANSPIRFRGHKIGEVKQVKLAKDLSNQIASAYLYGEYATHFSKQNTEYFVVDAQVSLAGIRDVDTLITGAYISVLPGDAESTNNQFEAKLAARYDANTPKDALTFTLIDKQLGSIKVGTPIFFRGIAIGQIDGYNLSKTGQQVLMFAHIRSEYSHLVNTSSQFWDASGIKLEVGIFSGAQIETGSLETLLSGGISVITKDITSNINVISPSSEFMLQNRMKPEWEEWKPAQQ